MANDNQMSSIHFDFPNWPPPKPEHFVAYDASGQQWRGTWDWETHEMTWSEPEPIPVGTVIRGGENMLTGLITPDLVWTGEEWRAAGDGKSI